jgi:hypothetical protein
VARRSPRRCGEAAGQVVGIGGDDLDIGCALRDHAVMAKQVRPWLAEPSRSAALRVRESEWEPASRSHQGRRHTPQQKSGCTGAIYPCKNHQELKAWQGWGRPSTDLSQSGALRSDEIPLGANGRSAENYTVEPFDRSWPVLRHGDSFYPRSCHLVPTQMQRYTEASAPGDR